MWHFACRELILDTNHMSYDVPSAAGIAHGEGWKMFRG
jgi:hypothetical protein